MSSPLKATPGLRWERVRCERTNRLFWRPINNSMAGRATISPHYQAR